MSTLARTGFTLFAAAMAVAFVSTTLGSSSADERAAPLDKAIPAAMERASIPGAIVGIWQDGREPYVRAFGVRDTATRQPMTTNLYMRIGSRSKTFTVTAVLMLADQGKLGGRFDRPIRRGRAKRQRDHAEAPRGNAQRALRLRRRDQSEAPGRAVSAVDAARAVGSPPSVIPCCFSRAAPSTTPTPTQSC